MRFTIDPEAFIRMVEMVSAGTPGQKPSGTLLRVSAAQERVWVEWGKEVAAAEVAVWEEGQCWVSRAQLLNALGHSRVARELQVEAEAKCLWLDGRSIPVRDYRPVAVPPAAVNIFLASDLGCVS